MTELPTVGRVYHFVRVNHGGVEVALFRRGEAGAAYCAADCWELESPAGDIDGWRDILAYLKRQGYVDWSEALAAGMLPAGWRPAE
jgi:hypothetical protein